MITVCLLAYNRPNYLGFAIESILAQTFVDFELLIIDNGSNIDTQTVIANYSDSRIRVLRFAENDINNINYPFVNPTRDYFMVMHDDDMMTPLFLEEMLNVFSKNNCVALASNFVKINEKNDIISINENYGDANLIRLNGDGIFEYFNKRMPACPTVIFDSSFMKKFRIKFEINKVGPACDMFMWSKMMSLGGEIFILNKPIYMYRKHVGQDSWGKSDYMELLLFRVWLNESFCSKQNEHRLILEIWKIFKRSIIKRRMSNLFLATKIICSKPMLFFRMMLVDNTVH
jgi:glycosyltransferase involved in cell wall biosynthesis